MFAWEKFLFVVYLILLVNLQLLSMKNIGKWSDYICIHNALEHVFYDYL